MQDKKLVCELIEAANALVISIRANAIAGAVASSCGGAIYLYLYVRQFLLVLRAKS